MGTITNIERTVDALCDLIDREALLAGEEAKQLLFRVGLHCRSRYVGSKKTATSQEYIHRHFTLALDVAERHFGVARQLILSRARPARICLARNAAFMLLRIHTNTQLRDIGAAFFRDASTVVHGCYSLAQRLDTEPRTDVLYQAAEQEFVERSREQGTGKGEA